MYQQGYRPPSPPPRHRDRPAGRTAPRGGTAQKRPAPAPQGHGYASQAAAARPARHKSGLGRVFFLFLVLAGLAFGAFYGKTWLEVRPYENTFAPNVFVDGIALSGMTAQEGVAAVRSGAQSKVESLSIRLMAGEQVYTTIDSTMLGLSYDTDKVLNQAWAVGHQGTVFDRKNQIENARGNGHELYSFLPDANTSAVDALLLQLKNEIYRAPQNASFSFEPDATNPFIFTDEVQGRSLDIEPLKEEIYRKVAAMESGDIQIIPSYTAPEITVASLKEQVALRYRATTPISSDSSENRTNNIRRAFELLSGTIVKPGDKFSFNNVVGWRTKERGFFEAPEYAYGELVQGIGGGACQASTTVYLAAICSGLQILDRSPHSDKVSYTDYGKDATVYMSSNRKIDLAFKNNTGGNIYITAAVKTDSANRKRFYCEVCIYGPSLGDVSYELEAKEVRTIPAPQEPDIVKDTDGKYVKYTDQQYTSIKAKSGHVVDSELVMYQNGVEMSRTQVAEDTYRERAARIYVGVTPR